MPVRGVRLLGCALAMVLALGAARSAAADTTTETGVTVTTENAGAFAIGFAEPDADGGYVFVSESGGPTLSVSAIAGSIGTATIRLDWTDDRAAGERTPYTIAIGATDLVSTVPKPDGSGPYAIAASNLAIVQIDGKALSPPLVLNQPRDVFTSAEPPEAGQRGLEIVLRLDVPPSSYPTTYETTLRVEVDFASDDP